MNYHLKSTRRPDRGKRLVTIIVGILIILLLIVPGFLLSISAIFAKGSLSLKERIVSGYVITSSYFTERNSLVSESERLLKIAEEVKAYRIKNQVLEKENIVLKGFRDELQDGDLIAQVLSLPPQTPFDTMLIESDSGFVVGSGVYSVSGVFVGTISEVSKRNAKVKLLSAADNTFFVENGRTGERYELVGRNSGNYFARLPKETDIVENDILIVRTNSSVDPVAVVGNIEVRESSPFISALAISPVSPFSMQHVVVKKIHEGE